MMLDKFTRWLISFMGAMILALSASSAYASYDRIILKNSTKYKIKAVAKYPGCSSDTWYQKAGKEVKNGIRGTVGRPKDGRGFCLVSVLRIYGLPGGTITWKPASATADVHFYVFKKSNGKYEVTSARNLSEKRASKKTRKMSPGFRITNDSNWPLLVSLNQVGCLYYHTLKPGEVKVWNTGAVWFSINASLRLSGKKLSDLEVAKDCVLPVAMVVGAAYSAAMAAADPASGASALSMFLAVPKAVGVSNLKRIGINAAKAVYTSLDNGLPENVTVASVHGAYAGPPWPGRCTHMPEYKITGGLAGGNGDKEFQKIATSNGDTKSLVKHLTNKSTPLKITKIKNGC